VPISIDVWGDRRPDIDERLALVVLTFDGLDLQIDIGVGRSATTEHREGVRQLAGSAITAARRA
jgi:hypothetical protein